MRSISIGTTGVATVRVTDGDTAAALGSGDVPVYGTPALVALLERAAVQALREALEPEEATVGTWIEVAHLAASPVGMEIRAEAELTAVAGRVLTFALRAYDVREQIARGEHRRAVVARGRFLGKANEKTTAAP